MSFEFLSLDQILDLAREYGYIVIFLGILLENAGIPLPGETITIVGGFLAGQGDLDYWLVLGVAILGATLGDSVGYWLGLWGGWPILVRLAKLFRIPEAHLFTAKERFAQNAGRAVFLGRFIALLRIFAGPLAGISRMPYWQFLLCNVAGAVTWASLTISLAFFAGQLIPLEQIISWSSQIGAGLVGVIALGWLVMYLAKRSAERVVKEVEATVLQQQEPAEETSL
jgi:membrane protein DedA with SNARE-associated domain